MTESARAPPATADRPEAGERRARQRANGSGAVEQQLSALVRERCREPLPYRLQRIVHGTPLAAHGLAHRRHSRGSIGDTVRDDSDTAVDPSVTG